MTNRNCSICSTEFQPKAHNAICCSDECRQAQWKNWYLKNRDRFINERLKNRVVKIVKRDCGICQKEFTSEGKKCGASRYCSDNCRDAASAWSLHKFETSEKGIASAKAAYEKYAQSEKGKKWAAEYYIKNREKSRQWEREYTEKHPESRLYSILRTTIGRMVEGDLDRTSQYIDYTPLQLKAHLEKMFKDGMDWSNHARKGWHIDHIKPLSAFKCVDENGNVIIEEVRKAMSLSNLQPLWYYENVRKGGMNRPENRKLYQLTAEGV